MLKERFLKPDSRCLPNKIYGIDFRGAKDAGSKIWIASALIGGNTIEIENCYQAKHLPDSAAERDQCLNALRHFISNQKACTCGLDFPFGLPRRLVEANNWDEFILSFGSRYPDPEKFRQAAGRLLATVKRSGIRTKRVRRHSLRITAGSTDRPTTEFVMYLLPW